MTTANVVFSGPATENLPIKRELQVATGQTILPGAIVTRDGSGDMINHTTAGQGGDIMIANMNVFEQKSVTDALTVGQNSEAFIASPGETYNVILADSQTIAVGAPLTSAGDGTVRACPTDGTETIMFTAEEAITTSGATARIRVVVVPFGYSA